MSATEGTTNQENKIVVNDFDFYYGDFKALIGLNLPIRTNQITALIGPSGCGKSTFLRSLNRMNDTISVARADGEILLDGKTSMHRVSMWSILRRRVGMVFQNLTHFHKAFMTMWRFGPRVMGLNHERNSTKLSKKPCSRL